MVFFSCLSAPKGHNSSAQGIALGNEVICDVSPEGAKPGFEMSFAPSGLRLKNDFPGRCPGLRSDRPLGAQIAGKILVFPPKSIECNVIGGHRAYKVQSPGERWFGRQRSGILISDSCRRSDDIPQSSLLSCISCCLYPVTLFFDSFLPYGVFQTSLSQRTLRRGGAEKFR